MGDNRQICIVTGASRGIGAAIAKLAAREGYAVVVNYFRSAAAAGKVVSEIEAAGGTALAIQADVGDPGDVSRLFASTIAELGRPTALVNSAAEPGGRHPIDQIDAATVQRVLAVTLAGPILCIAEAARCMATSNGGAGGSIVNISSQAARTGGRLLTAYASAKAGVETMTIALARELGPAGIRVNAVSPGLIATGSDPANDQAAERRTGEIPLGRLGQVNDVAEAVVWLMSARASYITGAIVPVTGGR
jgi:NAD(P)-dependent dehydrogenase (short-subunit alcohol dehydrogenase family)